MIVPASAEMGYVIHANIVDADVYIDGWNAGKIDENQQLYIPWEENSKLSTMTLDIMADGYIEIMEQLQRPEPEQIIHNYYDLYPYDNSEIIFGNIHLVTKPNGGDLYLKKTGSNDKWEYHESDTGNENFFHYLPKGTYDLLIRKPGFVPVRDTVVIPRGNTIDLFYIMQKGEEDPEAAALGVHQFTVIPTPTPVPGGTVNSSAGIQSVWEVQLEDSFYCTTISPDGFLIIAGTGNSRTARFRPEKIGKVYCFNNSGYNLWTQNTQGSVLDCALSDSGKIIGIGTDDGMLYCFDDQGYLLWKVEEPGSFVDIECSSDGYYVVGGSSNGGLYFFDKNGTSLWSFQTKQKINSVAMSEDGNSVVAGSSDAMISFFDKSGTKLWEKKISGENTFVSISSDGDTIAAGSQIPAGSEEGKIYLFDADGSIIQKYSVRGSVSDIQISSDGSIIGATTDFKKVYLFDRDGFLIWEKTMPSVAEKICFSSDGKFIGLSCLRFIYLFDQIGDLVWSFEQSGRIIDMDMSTNGSWISAGGNLFYYLKTSTDDNFAVDGEAGLAAERSPPSSDEKTELLFEPNVIFGIVAVVFVISVTAAVFSLFRSMQNEDDEE